MTATRLFSNSMSGVQAELWVIRPSKVFSPGISGICLSCTIPIAVTKYRTVKASPVLTLIFHSFSVSSHVASLSLVSN